MLDRPETEGHSDFSAPEAVYNSHRWSRRFIQPRIEPHGMGVLPSARAHQQLEILGPRNVGPQHSGRVARPDMGVDSPFIAVGGFGGNPACGTPRDIITPGPPAREKRQHPLDSTP